MPPSVNLKEMCSPLQGRKPGVVTLRSLIPVSWSPEKTLTFLSPLQLGQKEPRALEPSESQRPVQGDYGPKVPPSTSFLARDLYPTHSK